MPETTPPTEPSVPPDTTQQRLTEAVRQISRLVDLLARGGAGASVAQPAPTLSTPIVPTAGVPSPEATQAAGLSGLADVTNYTFHAPAAVGSRVTVRAVDPLGAGAALRAAAQAYAYGLSDYLEAKEVTVSPTDTLPDGGEYVVVTGSLPEGADQDDGATLRSAFVRLPVGSVQVEFVARADDPHAEEQFSNILRTLHPVQRASPVSGVFASLAVATDGDHRSAGALAFDLPPMFRGPSSATFADLERGVRLEVALAGPAPADVAPALTDSLFVGSLASATGDDGSQVLYEVAPSRPDVPTVTTAAAAPSSGPAIPKPTAGETTREVEWNGRRFRVTGVAGNTTAAQGLVQEAIDQLRPK